MKKKNIDVNETERENAKEKWKNVPEDKAALHTHTYASICVICNRKAYVMCVSE